MLKALQRLAQTGYILFSRGGVAGYWLAGFQRTVDQRVNLSQQKGVDLAERYSRNELGGQKPTHLKR
jgi:hypothetical protein